MKLLVTMLLAIISMSAEARLGENITQCDQRYNSTGANLSVDQMDYISKLITGLNTTNVVYRYDGWKIHIGYLNGYAVVMEYSRLDNKDIDASQARMIMNVNCPGETWTKEGYMTWVGSNGTIFKKKVLKVRLESALYARFVGGQKKILQQSVPVPGGSL